MAGPLKTLFQMLQASTYMTGVSFVFGGEEINTQRYKLPLVVMNPTGGPFVEPGYSEALDPAIEMLWERSESVDLWLWNASTDAANQGAVDHTDAIETLLTLTLSALQDQMAPSGLRADPVSGRWEIVTQNAPSPYGRAFVLTVKIAIPVVMTAPTEATVAKVTVSTVTFE